MGGGREVVLPDRPGPARPCRGRRAHRPLVTYRDHLSLYVLGFDAGDPDPTGLVVGGTGRYVHAQVRTLEDVAKVMTLLQRAYERQC